MIMQMTSVGLCEVKLTVWPKQTFFIQAWRRSSNLKMSVDKIKDMFVCAKQDFTTEPDGFDSQLVETVKSFRCLGSVLDNQLNLSEKY